VTPTGEPLGRAYAAAEALARSHYENFPVASWLLPAAMRPHVAAVYAFARVADDIADEGTAPAEDRLERLDAWKRMLHAAVAVEAAAEPAHAHEDLLIVAVAHSIRALELPLALFDDLISAFAQDTMTTRYDSWAQLFDYCRRSANPIGRLVLRIARVPARDDLLRASDAFCTALQLANFWQDVTVDLEKDRIYLPLDLLARYGYTVEDLFAKRFNERFRCVMKDAVEAARALFLKGLPLAGMVDRRLAIDLDLFSRGGLRVLEKIEQQGYDVLRARPSISKLERASLLLGAVTRQVFARAA
jgi:squalene synthase HpnC